MLLRKVLGAVLGAAIVSFGGAASAQDRIDWGGLYIGFHAGAAWPDIGWKDARAFPGGPVHRFNETASLAGGHIGWQQQMGSWVYGAEATLAGGRFEKSAPDVSGSGARYRTDVAWISTASGKLGYAVGRWLISAKAGYAYAEIANTGVTGGDSFRVGGGHNGLTLGAGLEYALTNSIIVGAGYDWIDLDERFRSGVSAAGAPIAIDVAPGSIHAVTTRLTFKLGRDERAAELLK